MRTIPELFQYISTEFPDHTFEQDKTVIRGESIIEISYKGNWLGTFYMNGAFRQDDSPNGMSLDMTDIRLIHLLYTELIGDSAARAKFRIFSSCLAEVPEEEPTRPPVKNPLHEDIF